MKKTLLVMALFCTTGAACAQTSPTSSVTLFGTIDLGLARLTGTGVTKTGMSNSGANINRIGFRGVEDLGAGLSAGFWLEAGLDPNTGGGKTNGALSFNRRATANLQGNFGELRVGRDDSATFLSTLIFDPFLTNGVGGTNTFVMNGAPIQISNAVSYFLPPDLGGFYGQVQIALGGQPSNAANSHQGDYSALRAGYRQGPLNVAFADGTLKGATSATDVTATNLAGWYDFQAVKPSFIWAREKTSVNTITGLQLGLIAPVGVTDIKASVGRFNNSLSNQGWNKLSLGLGYNLSKRTQIYASYGRLSNQSAAQRSINIQGLGAPGTSLGSNSSGYEMGLRHFF
jgi:predicted porin